MKTLIVYVKDSYFKFQDVRKDYEYFIDGGILNVMKRNPITGGSTEHMIFNSWDYYLVEEENDE